VPVSDYTPDVDAVAAYIRARTKTQGGAEAGTFNPADSWTDDSGEGTRPTAEQVAELIDRTVGKIANSIGVDIDEVYWEGAADVVALRTAMLTELTYWPEQVNTGRSTYPQLKDLWDEAWEDLLTSMGISTDEGGGAVPVGAGYPSYGGFPATGIGMEFDW
jgi:hypothetical protein